MNEKNCIKQKLNESIVSNQTLVLQNVDPL